MAGVELDADDPAGLEPAAEVERERPGERQLGAGGALDDRADEQAIRRAAARGRDRQRREAELDAAAGATGTVGFRQAEGTKVVPITVVEAEPPRRFAFRWDYEGNEATPENSLLVTFELVPVDGGTLLRFAETGYDEAAKPDEVYHDHVSGWDYFLPRIAPYVDRLAARP